MAFVEPITIKEAIENIHRRNYLLPAIQREFIWSVEQIETLFDSLMQDYPINSFLFWEVERENVKDFQFYEFIREYHERDGRHNTKASLDGTSGLIAILDGQQRLTSLYIGLKGSYTYRTRHGRWNNDASFPTRHLYLNLLHTPSEKHGTPYCFRFLTTREAETRDADHCWFRVSDILTLLEAADVNEWLIDNDLNTLEKEKSRLVNRTLHKLHEVIHKNRAINFFLERSKKLDKVLNIFIRVNSGGTELSYSDLLLSIATAQWKKKDAREEITKFVDEINAIGDGFHFNKDFVLKACLILSGFRDIAFKVDNFNTANMLAIENQWDEITEALRGAVNLANALGYHRDTLTSSNALIPIAYYLRTQNNPVNFAIASSFEADRKVIFKWLTIVLLKSVFSGQSDSVLRQTRAVIDEQNSQSGAGQGRPGEGFPFAAITDRLKGTSKSLSWDDDEIDNLLTYRYGKAHTYSVLAFLYPNLDFRHKFHQDHIFPQKMFTKTRLAGAGIKEEDAPFYLEKSDSLANLQLLEGIPNQEKSGKDFQSWLTEKYPTQAERDAYRERHYIPDIDLSFTNFRSFVQKREENLKKAFRTLLG